MLYSVASALSWIRIHWTVYHYSYVMKKLIDYIAFNYDSANFKQFQSQFSAYPFAFPRFDDSSSTSLIFWAMLFLKHMPYKTAEFYSNCHWHCWHSHFCVLQNSFNDTYIFMHVFDSYTIFIYFINVSLARQFPSIARISYNMLVRKTFIVLLVVLWFQLHLIAIYIKAKGK